MVKFLDRQHGDCVIVLHSNDGGVSSEIIPLGDSLTLHHRLFPRADNMLMYQGSLHFYALVPSSRSATETLYGKSHPAKIFKCHKCMYNARIYNVYVFLCVAQASTILL